ncbi:MAG: DNA mismatch repair endonuclease MutL [Rickettsiales bacterium]|nr:MAG: DNA mismatch repair endonuclease MutL [Rickettsiales bacterium]
MKIKLLSNTTINKISAGEVIERPASVVKELVENSIDAGATQIEITLEQAGKNLILVRDNGIGMSKEELELAIQRHATSKLDEDDLLNINSFGFRGEAMPSIGAISKFKITSRKRGSESAYSLSIIGGTQEATVGATSNEGTVIEVRDLFFATPARLKFLRTDRTELNASVNLIKRIALAHPSVAISLIHDGKELIKVKPLEGTSAEALKNRIIEIIGAEFIENAVQIDSVRGDNLRGDIEITGYTSLPTYNRASAEDQFLFINNRPVKDKILNIALRVAYQDYLSRDRHPVSVLFLRVAPHFVDVNVHPAKTEVRFHDPNLIRGMIISAIKNALSSSSYRVSTTASDAALSYMRGNSTQPDMQGNTQPAGFAEKASTSASATSQGGFSMPSGGRGSANRYAHTRGASSHAPRVDYALAQADFLAEAKPESFIETQQEELPKSRFPLGAAKAQLHGTYIISQTDDSIIITDQHAAHERIGYEKIKEQMEKNSMIKQRLLIPEIVELPDSARADILIDHQDALSKLGLTIEKFGEKSIIVSEIPSLVGEINPASLICDLAEHLISMGENIALTELIEHVTETYACHYAIRAGKKLGGHEMNALLRQMESTPFSGQCNHGRQTYVELKLADVEKLFGRR